MTSAQLYPHFLVKKEIVLEFEERLRNSIKKSSNRMIGMSEDCIKLIVFREIIENYTKLLVLEIAKFIDIEKDTDIIDWIHDNILIKKKKSNDIALSRAEDLIEELIKYLLEEIMNYEENIQEA